MGWPIDDLSTANLDADSDEVTGASGARDQILNAVEKVQAILAEVTPNATVYHSNNGANLAKKDENNKFTADQTINAPAPVIALNATGGIPQYALLENNILKGTYYYNGNSIRVYNLTSDALLELHNNGSINLYPRGDGRLTMSGSNIATEKYVTDITDTLVTKDDASTIKSYMAGVAEDGTIRWHNFPSLSVAHHYGGAQRGYIVTHSLNTGYYIANITPWNDSIKNTYRLFPVLADKTENLIDIWFYTALEDAAAAILGDQNGTFDSGFNLEIRTWQPS